MIARVLRPTAHEQEVPPGGASAIELRLPPRLYAAVALNADQTIYGAIRAARDRRDAVAASAPGGMSIGDAVMTR